MRLYKTHKKVLNFKNKPLTFLNGITSNDMDQPDNAFLNIRGRIVATFDQVQLNEEEMYLCIEEEFVDDVLIQIDRFIKLSGVQVAREDHHVYYDLDGNYSLAEEDIVIGQEKGRIIITKNKFNGNISEEEFTLFRLENKIPIHGIDYKDELLLNVSMTRFVSFTKGCYLGQEPISKVYSRSKPSWRLVVKFYDECSEEEKEKMTSKVVVPDSQRTWGFVFEKNS